MSPSPAKLSTMSTRNLIVRRIYEAFGFDQIPPYICAHPDPTTNTPCGIRLSQEAINNAYGVINRLAHQSPMNSNGMPTFIHRFVFVERLKRLANHTLCPQHAIPTIITNIVISWLNIALESPHLFCLSQELRLCYRYLHTCLPRLAAMVNKDRWYENFADFLYGLETQYPTHRLDHDIENNLFETFLEDFAQDTEDPTIPTILLGNHARQSETSQHIMHEPITLLNNTQSAHELDTVTAWEYNYSSSSPSSPYAPPIPPRSPYRDVLFSELSRPRADRTSSATESDDAQNECPICFDTFDCRLLSTCYTCHKVLHLGCLRRWAQNTRQKFLTCPLCRAAWRDRPLQFGLQGELDGYDADTEYDEIEFGDVRRRVEIQELIEPVYSSYEAEEGELNDEDGEDEGWQTPSEG